ncbi:MAG: hypothetical protein D6728_20755 [Cyanobacteria bacterium J055]|nr:MAG: hypothetical protein D6728_20755 [Cyanobacteria bacterium J055]
MLKFEVRIECAADRYVRLSKGFLGVAVIARPMGERTLPQALTAPRKKTFPRGDLQPSADIGWRCLQTQQQPV